MNRPTYIDSEWFEVNISDINHNWLDLVTWCQDMMGFAGSDGNWDRYQVRFFFKNEADVLMFKLKFGQ